MLPCKSHHDLVHTSHSCWCHPQLRTLILSCLKRQWHFLQSSPRCWHERVARDPRVAGLLERLDGHAEAGVLPDDLLRVLLRQEGVHQDKRHVCVVSEKVGTLTLSHHQSPYSLFRCSRCWTVRSSEVMLSRTGIVDVGPLHPKFVARAPLSLITTSLSSIILISESGREDNDWRSEWLRICREQIRAMYLRCFQISLNCSGAFQFCPRRHWARAVWQKCRRVSWSRRGQAPSPSCRSCPARSGGAWPAPRP